MLIVIFLFLLDWRATLIPALSMPVAMIGTIAAIYLAGFSVNILTLLALVLATGLVVDDAIVVLENIVRRRNEGIGPRAAAVLGTDEVFFAVIATTATLVAVFVPISFLPGQTGGLFREFGFVLAISVLLSCVVALTLCPMLASRMLSNASLHHESNGIGAKIGGGFPRLYAPLPARLPQRSAHRRARRRAVCRRGVFAVRLDPPGTDADGRPLGGAVCASMRRRASASITRPRRCAVSRNLIQPLRDSGEITSTFENAGQNGAYNAGFMVMTLAPWDQRSRTQQQIAAEIAQLDETGAKPAHFPACSPTAWAFAAPATACSSR